MKVYDETVVHIDTAVYNHLPPTHDRVRQDIKQSVAHSYVGLVVKQNLSILYQLVVAVHMPEVPWTLYCIPPPLNTVQAGHYGAFWTNTTLTFTYFLILNQNSTRH